MNAVNQPHGSIKFLTGPIAGSTFSLSKPITTIGRDPTNDIVVKGDQKVSRHHARLLWNNGLWSIEKIAQTNGVTINRQDVQQAHIPEGATVGLGEDSTFLFSMYTDVRPAADVISRPVSQQAQAFVRPSPPPPFSQTPVPPPPQQAFQSAAPMYTAPPQPQAFAPRKPPAPVGRPDETQIASIQSIGIPFIEVSSNVHGLKKPYMLDKASINIGRDDSNDIAIKDPIVSGLHAQITRQGNQFTIQHPHPNRDKTLNGLLYQGRKIRGDETFRKQLMNGDIFRIGDQNGTLVTLTFNDGTGTPEELVPPVQPYKLGAPELTIGRRPDNTIVLAHPQVSGQHARLAREGGSYRIYDLGSTNHVYVNSELTTNHLLKLGDEIRIGPYKLVYDSNELTQYDESNFIRIDALNLKKTGTNNVTLLNNLSFSVPPRKFVALVGGSGAGKSTLMDALNGLRPAQEGKVLYNGQDYYKNLVAYSSQLGYVPQDDIVHRDLTVERALYYAAKLRLPSDFTNQQINQRINEVLEDVEMTPRRKLLVKKLSGGQRKRVSIALELLANPSLFFLDEPTSGLDPGLDRKMMYLLRKLADKGHTIVLVTHATNNINTCDYVCFLCQGGRLAFFGPPEDAKSYFGKTDFAEIYSSLEPTEENPNVPEEAEARFKASPEYQEYVKKPLRTSPPTTGGVNGQASVKKKKRVKRGNPLKQFFLLAQRNLELLKNDRTNLIILLLQAPLIALLLMLLFRSEVGTGVFDANKVTQCFPRINQTRVASPQTGGVIGLPSNNNPPKVNNDANIKLVDCSNLADFLKNDSTGQAYVNTYHEGSQAKNQDKALQDFITTGDSINAERGLFIIAVVAVMLACINGTREIVKESSIYRRERAVNLGILPYLFSKFLVLGMLVLIQAASLLIVVQLFEPLQQGVILNVVPETFITLALTALAGLALGLTASAFAANEDSANSLLPLLIIPQIVFAGVEIPFKDYVLQIVAMLFPTRWAMAAMGSSVGLHSDKLGNDQFFGSDPTFHGTLHSVFTQTEAMQRILLSWGALAAIVIVFGVVICIGLKRKDIRK